MRRMLCVWLVVLHACVDETVDPRADATAGSSDAATQPEDDASLDPRHDAAPRPALDAALDGAADAAAEGLPDAAFDASEDATTETMLDAATDSSMDSAVAPVSLDVTVEGAGTGHVTSVPVGITCEAGTCSSDFDQSSTVTLSAEASTGSTFVGWGGACTGTGDCVVNLDGATSVTATFDVQSLTLQITKSGNGLGTVTGNGLDCGSTCMVSLPYGTQVTLTSMASSANATLSTLTAWSGAGCNGNGACAFMLTEDTTVDAAYALVPNLMFTTSTTYDGNLGGLAGADGKCQARAVAAGVSGTYRAYLGATGTNAPSRFTGASGWTRVDGQPLVQTIGDFGTTPLANAPILDESGNDLSGGATSRVWTASQVDGSYYGQNCNSLGTVPDWTNTVSQTIAGMLNATNANVLIGGGITPCASILHLYCFGIDRAATLP